MRQLALVFSALALFAFQSLPAADARLLSGSEKSSIRGGADCQGAVADATDCCMNCRKLSAAPSAICLDATCGTTCMDDGNPIEGGYRSCALGGYVCTGEMIAFTKGDCTGQQVSAEQCDVAFGVSSATETKVAGPCP